MNDINSFSEQEEGLAPADVRFIELHVEPWPDGRRVRVHLTLTPFLQRPNLLGVITNAAGKEVCSIHIVETMISKMVFTMHLREEKVDGEYTLTMNINYPDLGEVDQRNLVFETHEMPPAES